MGLMTRAKAAEVAEQLHINENTVLGLPSDRLQNPESTPPLADQRTPLGDIAPNSAANKENNMTEDIIEEKNSAKGKKGGKKAGRKGKKGNALVASTNVTPEETMHIIPDEIESQPSPATEAVSEDLMKLTPELQQWHVPVHDQKPNTPASNAVRLTRSQLRKVPSNLGPVEPKSLASEQLLTQPAKDEPTLEDPFLDGGVGVPKQVEPEKPDIDQESPSAIETPVPALSVAMPNNLQNDYGKGPSTPSKQHVNGNISSSSEKDVKLDQVKQNSAPYDKLEKAAVDASTPTGSNTRVNIPASDPPTYNELEAAAISTPNTPPKSTRNSSFFTRTQDVIAAMDMLEDEVEKINAEVPEVQESPEKPKSKKSAPLVRTTKASQARISLAHGPKDAPKAPALGRPRQSLALNQSTAKRVTSVASESAIDASADDVAPEKEVVIPHSKPRPISMHFPTPPPPPKSTKAPTKSNFQLPGEAIAAKLKAAKEARLQKEAEAAKKTTFKARPAPSFASKAPTVRQTSTSKARESIINGKPLAASTGSKRPHSVATTRPAVTKPATTARPNTSAKVAIKPAAASKPAARPISGVPPRVVKDLKVIKRPSTVMGTITNMPRPSLGPKPNPPAATSTTSSTALKTNGSGTAKGKEVFNRAAQAKSAAEKDKREKEEAAKKARAAAAERGRQASREWAEKQRLKKLGLKPEVNAEVEAPQCAAEIVDAVAPEADAETSAENVAVTESTPAPVAVES